MNKISIKGAYFRIGNNHPNQSQKKVYFQISHCLGSFTINPLAGKIMFRDVVYVTYDYSVRVQDGYIIFRWWRSYVPKDVSEDLSHSDTRLSVMLNGFELHIYNRSDLYAKLEKTFGLKPSMLVPVSCGEFIIFADACG
jgi:hypothetical protein